MSSSGSRSRSAVEPRVAIVLINDAASGTERRLAFVVKHLDRRYPGKYLLIINRNLYEILQRAGFELDQLTHIHILEYQSKIDLKRGRAGAGPLINLGRLTTLFQYRRELQGVLANRKIDILQTALEMVPFIGLFSLDGVKTVASIVSHLPKYYSKRYPICHILLRALRNYERIDALSEFIASSLTGLGVDSRKVNYPKWNCVDHIRFRPLEKRRIVTFSARSLNFKNPILMIDVIDKVVRTVPDAQFCLLGQGPLLNQLRTHIEDKGLQGSVTIDYLSDPSVIVNHSLVHVCIEEFDNATNQSLLEGMAAGCAIVASDVGMTNQVVNSEVGLLTEIESSSIAAALVKLLQDPEGAKRRGLAAREKILRDHHIDKYIDYLSQVHDFRRPGPVVGGV